MNRISVLLFSVLTLLLTVFSLSNPNYLLQELVSLQEPFVLARLFLILVLISYMFFEASRTVVFKAVLLSTGIMALGFGMITLFSPMLFGYLGTYVPIGEVFIFLEGGILALLMALQLPQFVPQQRPSEDFMPRPPIHIILRRYANFDSPS